ncbi:putative sucrose utilization protein SUC1 [Trichoderma lentiforme]|uniref:Sucrose utilization protein SUC1 n=1 Tax=Trichoderma lentiforme TaxID=1567552 RepID=A0A9P5CHA7_9HYPO|nr:putative sucrose utilization protein SUC1 [Trichoderma lentiforme]
MARDRACDACAARKVRCDRGLPCKRCQSLSIQCVAERRKLKAGPKGPWAQRKREALLNNKSAMEATMINRKAPIPVSDGDTHSQSSNQPHIYPGMNRVPSSAFEHYLGLYQQALYPVWPVVNIETLLNRLRDSTDIEAYALAAAVSAVTIAQLKPASHEALGRFGGDDGAFMASESSRARHELDYMEHPSISVLLTSFFLHVSYANRGHIRKGAMLLREAITFAQMLSLDKAGHYANLPKLEAQRHLRTIWLLFVTERGHTTRFDFPRILQLDPDLPELEVDENPPILFAFISLSKLFQSFANAMDGDGSSQTHEYFASMHARLRGVQQASWNSTDLQRADFLLTQQWMRVVLWKTSMYYINLLPNAADEGLSLSFPDQIARNVVQNIDRFPRSVIEAHGLGMEMKLFEVAMSLADILLCLPSTFQGKQLMNVGPRDVLNRLSEFLTCFRGGGDNIKLQILHDKMQEISSSIARQPRLLEDEQDQEREQEVDGLDWT